MLPLGRMARNPRTLRPYKQPNDQGAVVLGIVQSHNPVAGVHDGPLGLPKGVKQHSQPLGPASSSSPLAL